jgi:hypothetical protein
MNADFSHLFIRAYFICQEIYKSGSSEGRLIFIEPRACNMHRNSSLYVVESSNWKAEIQ